MLLFASTKNFQSYKKSVEKREDLSLLPLIVDSDIDGLNAFLLFVNPYVTRICLIHFFKRTRVRVSFYFLNLFIFGHLDSVILTAFLNLNFSFYFLLTLLFFMVGYGTEIYCATYVIYFAEAEIHCERLREYICIVPFHKGVDQHRLK